jgi:hypothetical protein
MRQLTPRSAIASSFTWEGPEISFLLRNAAGGAKWINYFYLLAEHLLNTFFIPD